MDAALVNLTTPAVLAFGLGIVAALVRSDLRLPEPIAKAISIYLLLAIGIKGGVALSESSLSDVWAPSLGTLAIGVVTPLTAYAVLRRTCRLTVIDAAAIAAHYGSVSLVTFAEALNFLEAVDVTAEGFMPALLTMLEIPGIVVALTIAKRFADRDGDGEQAGPLWDVVRHTFTESSVLLLVGGLVIGFITGTDGFGQIAPFLDDPFRGVLTLFLLQMGVIAGGHLRSLRTAGARLVVFALAAPVVNGALGVLVGRAVGLSLGGATVLGCMAASASYIAAPAAVGMTLPTANPGYYLPMAIGITFPFNVAAGIPLYYGMATLLY